MSEFKNLLEKRRSIYNLGDKSNYTKEEIVTAIRHAVSQAPSAFNSQTTRAVVLFDDAKERFWNHILEVQKGVMDSETYEFMSGVMKNAHDNALGTVLFFEDLDAVDGLPTQGERTVAYKQNNAGIAQYATWLRLAEMDLGGTLQHFNVGYEQGFDKETRAMFDLPDSYEMIAQMPFGSIETPADEKEVMDPERQTIVRTK